MASAPVEIPYRPYAVCPPTELMNPDGWFVVNMGAQYIEAVVRNTNAGELKNVRVYIESLSDPGIALTPSTSTFAAVGPGASVSVRFDASFTTATPGKPLVSFIVEADGHTYARVIKRIFVTRIDYDKPNKTYSVRVPEGTMRVRIHSAILGPRDSRCKDDGPFMVLPKDVSYEWVPDPSYAGTHGPMPFDDPWWKVALAVLAVLLAAAALLYDYFSDGTLDGGVVSVSGTFDETEPSVDCCTSVSTSASSSDDWFERGLYMAAGGAASLAIYSDGPDVQYRGQEATPPGGGEHTTLERVRMKVRYPVAPTLGTPYPIEGDWTYERTTTARTYGHSASDRRQNQHYLKAYEVKAPAVHDRAKGPLRVCARFQRPDGSYFKGGEAYVTAVLVSTYGATRRFQLRDDGLSLDEKADDGWYCGGYTFRRGKEDHQVGYVDRPGSWYLFVIAQDTNTVADGTDPFTAAHTIGGVVLTDQLKLDFDQPCKLDHDAAIQVV